MQVTCRVLLQHCPDILLKSPKQLLIGKVGQPPLLNLPYDLRSCEVMAAWQKGRGGAGCFTQQFRLVDCWGEGGIKLHTTKRASLGSITAGH